MTDDLGLGLSRDDTAVAGPPPYRRRRIIALIAGLAAIAVLVGGVALLSDKVRTLFGDPPDYSGTGTGSVVVQVHSGDSLSAIGQTLVDKGVVRSVGAFTDAANGTTSIGPGFYRVREHMSAASAVKLMLDPHALLQSTVVIPEGRRMRDIFASIVAGTNITLPALQAAAKDPAALGVPSWGAGHSLEGFLFPATYSFPPGTTAKQALQAMVRRFNQSASSLHLVKAAKALGRSPYDVLTVASIVEREGRLTSDFARIAEVFYNRLHQNMPLGSDATLFYVLPPDHGPLSNSDLHLDSPYNTRLHAGLPPTPIASPGDNALSAALHPANGNLLYFVTIDKAGHAAFATTLDEFNKLVQRSRANGVQ